MTEAPGYWMNETSGVLRPAVEAYLFHEDLSHEHIATLRAYFRQWVKRSRVRWPAGRFGSGQAGDRAAALDGRTDWFLVKQSMSG